VLTKLLDCPVCKKKDQPVRNDAKVCSSSCRVKQWRLNKKELPNTKQTSKP
jgi:hypothetical protein